MTLDIPTADLTTDPTAGPTRPAGEHDDLDSRRTARTRLRSRHTQNLSRLMEERADLRGIHPLADLVDEAVRWTA